uniref:Uncharacterized protein n=1 Tax=Amphimedon queenslandica TaxID=400682 RepID=A0A1X7U1T7_AMPQE
MVVGHDIMDVSGTTKFCADFINCYRSHVPFFIDNDSLSCDGGTIQGDPLAMALSALVSFISSEI